MEGSIDANGIASSAACVVKSGMVRGHTLQLHADSTQVAALTPQADALARMASSISSCRREEGWDVRPHPVLEAAAPSRAQFDTPATAPVVVMRNPIAGPQHVDGCDDLATPVPINTNAPVKLSTRIFDGCMQLHVR
jgi:hypothetical protein